MLWITNIMMNNHDDTRHGTVWKGRIMECLTTLEADKYMEEEKAYDCIKFLNNYCKRICEDCVLSRKKLCPCLKGERCPALWEI